VEGSERAKVERFDGLMDEQMGKESDSVTDRGAQAPARQRDRERKHPTGN